MPQYESKISMRSLSNLCEEYKKNKYTKNIKLVPYIDGMTSLLKITI